MCGEHEIVTARLIQDLLESSQVGVGQDRREKSFFPGILETFTKKNLKMGPIRHRPGKVCLAFHFVTNPHNIVGLYRILVYIFSCNVCTQLKYTTNNAWDCFYTYLHGRFFCVGVPKT